MRRLRPVVGLVAALACAAPAAAAPGDVDRSFGGDGRVAVPAVGSFAARGVAVDPVDRIVVGGYRCDDSEDGTCLEGGDTSFRVARLTPDGGMDPEFGVGGIVTTPVGEGRSQAFDVVVLDDGRIVAAGVAKAGGRDVFALARYAPNGALDPSFGAGGIALLPVGSSYSSIGDVERGPQGTLLIAGQAVDPGGAPRMAIARVTAGGALDPGFGTGGAVLGGPGRYGYGLGLAVLPNGRVLATGIAGDSPALETFRFGELATTAQGAVVGAVEQRVGTTYSFANALSALPAGGVLAAGAGFLADGHQAAAVLRVDPRGRFRSRLIPAGDGAVANDVRADPAGGAWLIGQAAHGGDYTFLTARLDGEGRAQRVVEVGWPDYPVARATAGALQRSGRLVTVGIGCAGGYKAECEGGTPVLLVARQLGGGFTPAVRVPRSITRARLRRGLRVRVRLSRPQRVVVRLEARGRLLRRVRSARARRRFAWRLRADVRRGPLRLTVRAGNESVTRTVRLRG